MSVRGAEMFLKTAIADPDLRTLVNECESYDDCQTILADKGMEFTEDEYENAFNHLRMLCRVDDQARMLKEINGWWRVLRTILGVC